MSEIRIEVISRGGPKEIDTRKIAADVNRLMRDVTADGQRLIATYPPQRLRKTRYRRTGTLKRSWSRKIRRRGNDLTGEVGSNSNIAPYNRYVQGQRPVKIFRRAGWKNVDDLAEQMVDDFNDGLDDIIEKATGGS